MNRKTKSALFFGISISIFFILIGFLIEDNFTAKNVTKIIISAIIGGAVGGIVFSWNTAKILHEKRGRKDKARFNL